MNERDSPPPDESSANSEQDKWTPELFSKVLFHSFRHSQGNRLLHHSLFDYIRSRHGRFSVPDAWVEPVETQLTATIRSYLQANEPFSTESPYHDRVPTQHIPKEVHIAVSAFRETLAQEELYSSHAEIVASITEWMLTSDRQYQRLRQGRPRKQDLRIEQDSPYHDPRFRYLRYYALDHHPTGVDVFDQMYREVGAYLASLSPESRQALDEAVLNHVRAALEWRTREKKRNRHSH